MVDLVINLYVVNLSRAPHLDTPSISIVFFWFDFAQVSIPLFYYNHVLQRNTAQDFFLF